MKGRTAFSFALCEPPVRLFSYPCPPFLLTRRISIVDQLKIRTTERVDRRSTILAERRRTRSLVLVLLSINPSTFLPFCERLFEARWKSDSRERARSTFSRGEASLFEERTRGFPWKRSNVAASGINSANRKGP